MRILYIIGFYKSAGVYGGPARSVPQICEGMAKAGAAVSVYTTNANGAERLPVPLGKPILTDGVQVTYFPVVSERFFYSPALVKAVHRDAASFDLVDIDCLFAHGLTASSRSCLKAGVPYVVPMRGQMLPWSLSHRSWRKRLYLAAFGRRSLDRAAALHCTDEVEEEGLRNLGFHTPTITIPNPIDTRSFDVIPPRGKFRQELGIPESAICLLFLGRLHQIKRPDIAVHALAAARAAGKPAHLLIAGADEQNMATGLLHLAGAFGCADCVHILPLLNTEQVRHALADTDLLLMPSESENFGMAAAEALASGVPVLCSDTVPIGRWSENAGAGKTAPCDPQQFAMAVLDLLSTPIASLRGMGERGKTLIRTRFDTAIVAKEMLSAFAMISSRSRSSRDEVSAPATSPNRHLAV